MKILKRWMAAHSYTLKELADETGVSGSGLSRILRGERTPSIGTLKKLHETTKIPYEELVK